MSRPKHTAFFVPLSSEMLDMSGQSARLLVALVRRADRQHQGQFDLDDFCRSLRMGRQTALEALECLERVGVVRYIVRLSVVAYTIVARGSKRLVKIEQWAAERLETMAPATVLAWLALQWHMNARDRLCWPSNHRIGGLIKRCGRTVQRALRALREAGLMVVTKVHWSRIPRFKWPSFKLTPARRFCQKRISVYAASDIPLPSCALTVSPDRTELCREVIRNLQNEAWTLAEKDRQTEPQDGKPHGIWAELGCLGFTYGQVAWMRPRFGDGAILEGIRNLNERWARVRDRKKYLLRYLWRRCESLPG